MKSPNFNLQKKTFALYCYCMYTVDCLDAKLHVYSRLSRRTKGCGIILIYQVIKLPVQQIVKFNEDKTFGQIQLNVPSVFFKDLLLLKMSAAKRDAKHVYCTMNINLLNAGQSCNLNDLNQTLT